jgi:hypothetical protein
VGANVENGPLNRVSRIQAQQPVRLIYIGLALFLGGCVFTIVLTGLTESSTAIGLAFLCSMPIGFILLVTGVIMSMARREGRRLEDQTPGTGRTGRRTLERW